MIFHNSGIDFWRQNPSKINCKMTSKIAYLNLSHFGLKLRHKIPPRRSQNAHMTPQEGPRRSKMSTRCLKETFMTLWTSEYDHIRHRASRVRRSWSFAVRRHSITYSLTHLYLLTLYFLPLKGPEIALPRWNPPPHPARQDVTESLKNQYFQTLDP